MTPPAPCPVCHQPHETVLRHGRSPSARRQELRWWAFPGSIPLWLSPHTSPWRPHFALSEENFYKQLYHNITCTFNFKYIDLRLLSQSHHPSPQALFWSAVAVTQTCRTSLGGMFVQDRTQIFRSRNGRFLSTIWEALAFRNSFLKITRFGEELAVTDRHHKTLLMTSQTLVPQENQKLK